MYNREYTPERISVLKENEIFVFGSNLAGSHGGGAARLAYNRFGAIWGQGVGLQGQSYAIPTMHEESMSSNLTWMNSSCLPRSIQSTVPCYPYWLRYRCFYSGRDRSAV